MDNNKFKLTAAGVEKLKNELENLKTNERTRNLEALKEARAQGDLSENADYDSAREEQARIETRIKEIENILKNTELITEDRSKIVNIGKTVKVKIDDNNPVEYHLVGALEADPFNFKISNESPVGKAIIGHKKGDKVRAKTESNREIAIEIIEVK